MVKANSTVVEKTSIHKSETSSGGIGDKEISKFPDCMIMTFDPKSMYNRLDTFEKDMKPSISIIIPA
jgi:hypothetical protein